MLYTHVVGLVYERTQLLLLLRLTPKPVLGRERVLSRTHHA